MAASVTPKLFRDALDELSLLKFFPSEPGARAALLRMLCQMVAGPTELRWLIDTVLRYHNEWPGPLELRGIYCTHYKPKDGVEADVTSGRMLGELEERALEAEPLTELPASAGSQRLIEGMKKDWPK